MRARGWAREETERVRVVRTMEARLVSDQQALIKPTASSLGAPIAQLTGIGTVGLLAESKPTASSLGAPIEQLTGIGTVGLLAESKPTTSSLGVSERAAHRHRPTR